MDSPQTDCFPISDIPNQRTNQVLYSIIPLSPTGIGYTDLTGRFPTRLSRGNEYIFVSYHYDANAILAIPLKNRTSPCIISAWSELNNVYKKAGCALQIYLQDNKISKEMKDTFSTENITFQLVPPGNHHSNAAERAI